MVPTEHYVSPCLGGQKCPIGDNGYHRWMASTKIPDGYNSRADTFINEQLRLPESQRSLRRIFNECRHEDNDELKLNQHRMQQSTVKTHLRHPSDQTFLADFKLEVAGILDAVHICGNLNLLVALPGCANQLLHYDFPNHKTYPTQPPYPLSVILATQAGTKLFIIPKSSHADLGKIDRGRVIQVDLRVGEALMFYGHVIHGGSGYQVLHHRLHMYVKVAGVAFPDNVTLLAMNV
jgi:hypothetical protein